MKLVINVILVVCALGMLTGFTSNRKLLKEHDYITVIRNSIDKLNRDANNKKAMKTITQTYSKARAYYQDKLDQILTSSEPFKWTKTLEVMQKSNELSEDILFNSSASHLICEPKIYAAEIGEIRTKGTEELYEEGLRCLNQPSKEKAKEAYFYFLRAQKLNSTYKDIESKIRLARKEATFRVIVEPVSAFTQNKVLGFSTKAFYESLLYSFRQEFPFSGYVFFYSPEDANKEGITDPDYTMQIEISDIEFTTKRSGAIVDGSLEMINQNKSFPTQLLIKANTLLKIYSVEEDKVVYKERFPWHYIEDLYYANFTTINQRKITLSNDNQVFFDRFALSLCDPITSTTSGYFYDALPLNNTVSISAVP